MKRAPLLLLLLAAALPLCGQEEAPVRPTVVDSVLAEARSHLGAPYRRGGRSPEGFDDAGFTRYVYGLFGYFLPPAAVPQSRQGVAVDAADLRPGDLVFFGGSRSGRRVGHVGIVTDVDSAGFRFIHASSRGVTITASTDVYYRQRYLSARRLVKWKPAPKLPSAPVE